MLQARQLLQQGRQALQHNELDRARQLAEQASSLKPSFVWHEDTPDKLLADIQRVQKAQVPLVAAKSGPAAETAAVDGHALLKQGRDLYVAGKLDEAHQRAILAQGTPGTHRGLLEDNPDKLIHDIQKARVKRDQEESEHQLAEARTLFDQGDLEGTRGHQGGIPGQISDLVAE